METEKRADTATKNNQTTKDNKLLRIKTGSEGRV
jgi:hypothetical protein